VSKAISASIGRRGIRTGKGRSSVKTLRLLKNSREAVSKPSMGLKIEEGEEEQPEEYMKIFRGLHFEPDKDIESKGRF
jgi:hypothetical protein